MKSSGPLVGVLTVLKILALERIQKESERTNMNGYRIEDEFFTGILRTKAGIKNVTMMDQERDLKKFPTKK